MHRVSVAPTTNLNRYQKIYCQLIIYNRRLLFPCLLGNTATVFYLVEIDIKYSLCDHISAHQLKIKFSLLQCIKSPFLWEVEFTHQARQKNLR